MNHIIIGGGPTGLSLAYYLSLEISSSDRIVLIEKDKQLGGSWNSQWIDNKYWSENSPRVLSYSKYTKQFLNDIGINEKDVMPVYGNTFSTNKKIVEFVLSNFSLKDYFIFLGGFVKYRLVDNMSQKHNNNVLFQDWLDISGLSEKARRALTIISITICDRPDRTNIYDFFYTIRFFEGFKQFKDPNKWHTLAEKKLIDCGNVNILKNHMVVGLFEKNKKVDKVEILDIANKTKNKIILKDNLKVYLCAQSSGILSILNNSSSDIQNNWYSYSFMKKWCRNTYYNGFGFQIHFKKEKQFSEKWCWSCFGDWSVIILPVSNWLTEFSKDREIKSVWSCCVVDCDSKSSRINKTLNECETKEEALEECLYQIDINIGQENKEIVVTTSEGLTRSDGKWVSKNTGFTQSNLGRLPFKGKIDNLFALGCFSERTRPNIAKMETAIDSVFSFLQKPKKQKKHHSMYFIFLFILISLFLVFHLAHHLK